MPLGDRTGPEGMGPRTGRRMGYCAGFDTPGYVDSGFERGFGIGRKYGRGRGIGRGFGRRFISRARFRTMTRNEEPTLKKSNVFWSRKKGR